MDDKKDAPERKPSRGIWRKITGIFVCFALLVIGVAGGHWMASSSTTRNTAYTDTAAYSQGYQAGYDAGYVAGMIAPNSFPEIDDVQRISEEKQAELAAAEAQSTDEAQLIATPEDEPPAVTESQAAEGPQYVLNTNTLRFHIVDCPSVNDMYEANRQLSNLPRDEIISMGYEPCKRCNP